MLIEKIKKENIDLHAKGLDYYIIYYFDRLEYGKGDLEPQIDMENIYEAFLFDEKKCLHIYREDGIQGIMYIDEENDEILFEEQIAKKAFKSLKKIIVKKYIKYDEDEQAYIERVLPSKLILSEEAS
jgi:hypothetical protein